MDTPNKIFSIYISSKENKFSFDELSFIRGKLLFSFFQNEEVVIDYIGDEYCLEIETNEKENGEYMIYKTRSDTPYSLNSNLFQTVPFIYKINILSIKTKKRLFSAFYRSKPLPGINSSQFENMIAKLVDVNETMVYSEHNDKVGSKIHGSYKRLKFHKNIIENILSHKNSIIFSTLNIEKNYNFEAKKIITRGTELKKQSRKTSVLNAVKINGHKFYSCATVQDYNTKLNSYFIFIVERIIDGLEKLHEIVLLDNIQLSKSIDFNRDLLKGSDIGENTRAQLIKVTSIKEKEIEKINEFISFSKWLTIELTKIRNKLFEIGVKKSDIRDGSISLNRDYSLIESYLYFPIQYNYFAHSFSSNNFLASALNDTSKLFEFYCVIIFVEAIFEIGFSTNKNYDSFILELLQSNVEQELFFGDFKIRLGYESNTIDSFKISNSGISLTALEEKATPDLYFVLFKNNIPIYFYICDFKCRIMNQLLKESRKKSKTNKTIRKYSAIQYYMSESKSFVNLNQLCFICPDTEYTESFGTNNIFNIKTLIVDGYDEIAKNRIISTLANVMK